MKNFKKIQDFTTKSLNQFSEKDMSQIRGGDAFDFVIVWKTEEQKKKEEESGD